MKWFRSIIAAGVLAGISVGCSKNSVASKPANAPAVEDEKPLGTPRGPGAGPKQRGK